MRKGENMARQITKQFNPYICDSCGFACLGGEKIFKFCPYCGKTTLKSFRDEEFVKFYQYCMMLDAKKKKNPDKFFRDRFR
jgi:predicted RNA-binding Zn-ribbon protein involved in translation (DUF1610 family)